MYSSEHKTIKPRIWVFCLAYLIRVRPRRVLESWIWKPAILPKNGVQSTCFLKWTTKWRCMNQWSSSQSSARRIALQTTSPLPIYAITKKRRVTSSPLWRVLFAYTILINGVIKTWWFWSCTEKQSDWSLFCCLSVLFWPEAHRHTYCHTRQLVWQIMPVDNTHIP